MGPKALIAFGKGVVSQFHPRMLLLLLLPVAVSLIAWAAVAWWLWDPVTGWLRVTWFSGEGWIARGYAWVAQYGLAGLDQWIPNLFAFLLLVPLAIVTALVLVSVLAMPAVLRFLGKREYADVERSGSFGVTPGLLNALRTLAIFVPGYLLTMPLWLVPPLALIVPWLWWGWLTARLLRFDSSVEHASAEEQERLLRRSRAGYLALGLACAALNWVPPLILVAPVLSALVFAHYSLARLRELRIPAPRAIVQERYPLTGRQA